MTVPPRTPSWKEIEEFCRIDGWTKVRETDHRHFRKVLDSGEVLETHTSFDSSGTMSQSRFSLILKTQLRVSRREFWEAIRSVRPVDRPVSQDEQSPPLHEAWVLRVLKHDLRLSDAEIAELSVEDARQRVHEHRSEPRTD